MSNAKDAWGGPGVTPGRLALAVASAFVLAAVSMVAPASATVHDHPAPLGPPAKITTFAKVPEPGHPYGVLGVGGVVYVTTGGGNPTKVNPSQSERLFTYNKRGRLISSKPVIAGSPNMGLYDIARDAEGRLYVSDMNGRVLRFRVKKNGKPTGGEVYASVPAPEALGAWYTSMWSGIAFDRKGNLYVSDSQNATVWRIPPNGEPERYFRDVRLAGGAPGGPFGATLGPDGKLYVTVISSAVPGNMHDGIVYRLKLSENPTAEDLETFHVFRVRDDQPLPGSMDVVFGKSGRVYVTLGYGYQVAVLSRDGKLLRRISSPEFATPTGIAFYGRSLLVANVDFAPEEREKWKILRVWVNDRGVAPIRPSVDRAARGQPPPAAPAPPHLHHGP